LTLFTAGLLTSVPLFGAGGDASPHPVAIDATTRTVKKMIALVRI
jgi:hypothetical protein